MDYILKILKLLWNGVNKKSKETALKGKIIRTKFVYFIQIKVVS